MYLAEVVARNFRIFGSPPLEAPAARRAMEQAPSPQDLLSEDRSLCLSLRKGINVLVGENDSGKTAVIDAIRFCLWTTSQEYHRFSEDDFHCGDEGRAPELVLRCKFLDLSVDDQATFLEWLTTPEGEPPSLYVTTKSADHTGWNQSTDRGLYTVWSEWRGTAI